MVRYYSASPLPSHLVFPTPGNPAHLSTCSLKPLYSLIALDFTSNSLHITLYFTLPLLCTNQALLNLYFSLVYFTLLVLYSTLFYSLLYFTSTFLHLYSTLPILYSTLYFTSTILYSKLLYIYFRLLSSTFLCFTSA